MQKFSTFGGQVPRIYGKNGSCQLVFGIHFESKCVSRISYNCRTTQHQRRVTGRRPGCGLSLGGCAAHCAAVLRTRGPGRAEAGTEGGRACCGGCNEARRHKLSPALMPPTLQRKDHPKRETYLLKQELLSTQEKSAGCSVCGQLHICRNKQAHKKSCGMVITGRWEN